MLFVVHTWHRALCLEDMFVWVDETGSVLETTFVDLDILSVV